MDQGFKHLAKVAKIFPNLVTLILVCSGFESNPMTIIFK